jgi:hypothetical protein
VRRLTATSISCCTIALQDAKVCPREERHEGTQPLPLVSVSVAPRLHIVHAGQWKNRVPVFGGTQHAVEYGAIGSVGTPTMIGPRECDPFILIEVDQSQRRHFGSTTLT